MDAEWPWWLYRMGFALLGAFGTAWVNERTGREVSGGGWLGLLVGGLFGLYGLGMLWSWLLFDRPALPVRITNPKRRWYTWWLP